MKNQGKYILLSLPLGISCIGYGANPPPIDVTISNADGKLVMKGQTNPNGIVSVGKVAAGDYVVQFKCQSSELSGQYAVVVSAGKKKVSASAVAAEQFRKGGVAMKLDAVREGMNITGQVAPTSIDSARIKIINGKRMIWVTTYNTGSNIRGHWVEEGSKEISDVTNFGANSINRMQEHADIRYGAGSKGQ